MEKKLTKVTTVNLTRRVATLLVCAIAAAFFQTASAPSAFADSILGSQLTSFAVLGASTVTNTGATTITGNVGVSPGTAITGASTITFAGAGVYYNGTDATGVAAQTQLFNALGFLAGLAPTVTYSSGVLDGLTLAQGVYAVSAAAGNGGFNLSSGSTGTLRLDAQGQTNPFWVFQMSSTLITGSGSVVEFINTPSVGFNPGLYWDVGSSTTLGTTTSFQGNILALTNITLNTGATIGCGSALAHVEAVNLDHNTISTGCNGSLSVTTGSGGTPVVIGPGGTPLPVSTPEPGTLVLLCSGLGLLIGFMPRLARVQKRT